MTIFSEAILIFLTYPSLVFAISAVNSHSNKLLSKHYSRDYYSNNEHCFQEAVCTPLQNATCFGTTLPYTSTSTTLAEDSISHFEIQDNLALWQGLRSVPRCWAVVQPFLCAVYMPKCDNGSVFLPTQEMCHATRDPCKSVEVKHGWPSFLKCENKKLFPPRCRNPLQEVKFNISSKCVSPLIETDNPDNYFHEVTGCGIQCQDPFFSEAEHNETHTLISVLASICFVMTAFTVMTFIINWKIANCYPGVIIFYINVCLAIVSFGWLIQFFPGARDEIVCSYDGTIRRKQPRSGQHLCSITFILTYYFMMASIVWFVVLTYAWHVLFNKTGTFKELVTKKNPYFQIFAWCLPLVLTVVVISAQEVDGDSMSGICFVGYSNIKMRFAFLLAPIGVLVFIGSICLIYTLCKLIKDKLKGKEVVNLERKKEVHNFILKIGLFSACTVVIIICTIACHAYDFLNRKEWDESLRDYIVCRAMNAGNMYYSEGEIPKCTLKSKPSIAVIHIHLFCLFGYGIIMSLWAWVSTKQALESWKCFFYRLCEPEEKKANRKMYEAYQSSRVINQGQVFGDAVVMNLDANSAVSKDIFTTWAAAFPRFLECRNAVTDPVLAMPRQYSSVSDMSRHISLDSFNQSNLDSLSLQISEQVLKHQRRKTRRERERLLKASAIAPRFSVKRRGSDTSLSSLMAASIAAAAAKKAGLRANVTRATSTGDLEVPVPGSSMFPPFMMLPPNNRPNVQLQRPTCNPPFTHGMTDIAHRLGSRVPSALPGPNANQRFTPSQCSVVPNTAVMGMVPQQPMYGGGSYDVLNTMPYGYVGGNMYPTMNGMYYGYPYNAEYMYNPYGAMPYSFSPCSNQYQGDILPMNPIQDSASETDFPSIRITDSDYTDTGMRSYDESQLMTTARLVEEQLQARAAEAAAAAAQIAQAQQPKPKLEPQTSAKTQFLERMGSFNTKTIGAALQTTSRPPSGRKTSHTEAPPPSPAESLKSLDDDELDDVFVDEPQIQKDASVLSLPPASSETENMFQKIKSKFRRATSSMYNLEKPEAIELASRPCHSSLSQLSDSSPPVEGSKPQKDVLKEKWLHASEGVSLMNGDAATENVSR